MKGEEKKKSKVNLNLTGGKEMSKIKTALISVSDKTGIVGFASQLHDRGIKILSTGGTARVLKAVGLNVTDVSEHTGFPEMFDGRLKTLHPKVHGGLLWRRENPKDDDDVKNLKEKHNITMEKIDMVVVNLYPFEKTIAKPDCTFDDAIENIDIGGPTMIRAASKNFKDVTVVVDPNDYVKVLNEIKADGGGVSYGTKFYLAKKVFAHTANYDTLISKFLETQKIQEAE